MPSFPMYNLAVEKSDSHVLAAERVLKAVYCYLVMRLVSIHIQAVVPGRG
jgi:hypothetical protein